MEDVFGDGLFPGPPVTDRPAVVLAGILFLLCLMAVAGNGFITAVLGIEWLQRRKLSPCDKLLVSLGASRFCLQWVVIEKNVYFFLHPRAFPYTPLTQVFSFQWDFLNAATLWFSTWLSVFYCVKISTFTHPTFLWLKQKVSGWVPWMLLSSLGLSSFSTLFFLFGNWQVYQDHLRRDRHTHNVTRDSTRRFYERFYFFPLKVVTWMLPMTLFLVSMIMLFTSLSRYAKKALLTMSRCRDTRARAHLRALLALVSFTVLFASYLLSLLLSAVGIPPSQERQYWMSEVMTYTCSATHSITLLLSNSRLRALLWQRCRQLRAPGVLSDKSQRG
ncbi:PREDICTED: taste receptor type 2 member 60-like [Elephantulus edwardii]|uniref:taste receptor type 2 member 60-like n=1 Tax=Elephantulus edwardii TaxID=28737 RepID=UPI0003F0C163|nr:PREDICTED: taste receptor type 2 member 60-like [Elephantulus edwardii]